MLPSNSILGMLDGMAALILTSAIWAAVAMAMPAYAQFNMWPTVDSTQLASALGFSVECLNAMYEYSTQMCNEHR